MKRNKIFAWIVFAILFIFFFSIFGLTLTYFGSNPEPEKNPDQIKEPIDTGTNIKVNPMIESLYSTGTPKK